MAESRNQSYIIWMAWRHLTTRKRRGLSFMTTISVFGVAIGVCALVTVLSVMGGFENDLKSKMFRGLPHIEVMAENPVLGFSLEKYPLDKFSSLVSDQAGIEPFTKADVVLKHTKHLASVTLFGIDPKVGGKLWGFSSHLTKGRIKDLESEDGARHIILGDSLAMQLGAKVGEEVNVLNPQASISMPLSGEVIAARFKVIGIFQTDLPRYDSRYGVVSLSHGRKFMADYDYSLDQQKYVTGVAINIKNPEHVEKAESSLKKTGLSIMTWKQVNQSLLLALKLEKFTMGSILLLIVLVAAFSISGTLMMTVFHKRGQVALLRSLGMTRKQIVRLFLTHGLTIGTVGTVFGLILGLLLCLSIYYFQFIELPEGVYYQTKLPIKFLPMEYMAICLSAWLLSLLAAAYPALVASRNDPGSGLRYS